MKKRDLLSLLTVTLGFAAAGAIIAAITVTLVFAAVGTHSTLTQAHGGVSRPTQTPVAAAAAPAESEASARVNVKAIAARLEFLGDKPVLTGHPLLLEFWATWCPPCRASIPHLNKVDEQFHHRGLQIVGITGEDKAVVERFRARTPMNYAVALDTGHAVANEFQVQGIPQAWLLDKEGQVVWTGHPMELDEQTIARVLLIHPAT
jgi:thiol-disulfide isomerase/thioredoxin